MTERVASIMAQVGIDSSKFKTGAKDILSGLGNISSGFKNMLTTAGMISVATTAVKALADYIKEAVKATDEYVTSMTDMSRMTGINIEDVSRLTQAADDLFISQSSLNTALTAASRQGIDVSISGLKKLSTEYLSLNSASERAAFLAKNFGRSGMDMGKLLEVGADGIEKATEAIGDNLVVTDESKKITYDYKRSVDALNDTMDGLKYKIAAEAMPTMTAFNIVLSDMIDKAAAANVNLVDLGASILTAPMGVNYSLLTDVLKKQAETITEAEEGVKSLTRATDDYSLSAGNMSVVTLSASETFSTMLSMVDQLGGLEGKTADEVELATHRIELSYLEQLLATDGLTEGEVDKLLTLGVQWGVYSQTAVDEMRTVMDEASNLANSINEIPEAKTISLKVKVSQEGSINTTNFANPTHGMSETSPHASGGTFQIPASYGYEGFSLGGGDTASGGEKLQIIPQGQTGMTYDQANTMIKELRLLPAVLMSVMAKGSA